MAVPAPDAPLFLFIDHFCFIDLGEDNAAIVEPGESINSPTTVMMMIVN
jgi:hypothetical protein